LLTIEARRGCIYRTVGRRLRLRRSKKKKGVQSLWEGKGEGGVDDILDIYSPPFHMIFDDHGSGEIACAIPTKHKILFFLFPLANYCM
jgi:hypothetical protein